MATTEKLKILTGVVIIQRTFKPQKDEYARICKYFTEFAPLRSIDAKIEGKNNLKPFDIWKIHTNKQKGLVTFIVLRADKGQKTLKSLEKSLGENNVPTFFLSREALYSFARQTRKRSENNLKR